MRKYRFRRKQKAGLAPGTLMYTGEHRLERTQITVIDYHASQVRELEVQSVEECFPFRDSDSVTWINVVGLHDVKPIEKLGAHFKLHPLLMEDVLNTEQRPKLEDYDGYVFIVIKMIRYDRQTLSAEAEQVSIVVGPTYVITFLERPSDIFDKIRERIRNGKGRIRTMGADYLAYAVIDSVVDHYFVVLEELGQHIEDVEDEVVASPRRATVSVIHGLKRELLLLRRSIWPLREVISQLQREEGNLFGEPLRPFLRDVYDHTIQVIDAVETYRDILTGLLDVYLSSLSNKMNEIMKMLTVIATIFIPLTFIAGVYGMNFKYMPELEWRYGYPAVWIVNLLIAGGMLWYFRRKEWL